MDAGEIARGADRGGEVIPPLRASRLRLTIALTALLLGLALAAYPLADAGRDALAVRPLAGAALVLLLFSATGWPRVLGLALAALAAEFVTHELTVGAPAAAAIGYGAGLLLLAELLSWGTTLDRSALIERSVALRHVAGLGTTAIVGAAVASAALLGASVSGSSALVAACIGSVAAVGLLGLVRQLVR